MRKFRNEYSDEEEVMRIREHHGYGHGLRPGENRDLNCSSCKRHAASLAHSRESGEAPMIKTGDRVTYLGHEATVIHVFTTTANIRLNKPVPGLSRQQDVMLTSLRRNF